MLFDVSSGRFGTNGRAALSPALQGGWNGSRDYDATASGEASVGLIIGTRCARPLQFLAVEGRMEKIDAKLLGMVSVTLLTRLTAHMERTGILPLGWTAGELRQAAAAAENNILHGADPEFHHAFAKALCRVADLSLQPISDDDTEEPSAPTLR